MDVEPLVEHAYAHPPRCLAGLRVTPLRQLLQGMTTYPFMAYFRVGCPCGENATYVLGYHAKDEGDSSTDIFISPLAVECPACGTVTELIDTRTHGYEGEQGCDCNMTGTGPRSRFPCPTCGIVPLIAMPGFSYQNDDVESWSGEQGQRPQDFFGDFSLYGGCVRCRNVIDITGFECA
jgi:hypothetical protein